MPHLLILWNMNWAKNPVFTHSLDLKVSFFALKSS